VPKVTLSMPVYQRPERTARMIRAILSQTEKDWEAFVIGDCCPFFKNYDALLSDPRFWSWNQPKNGGGFGYQITNISIQHATGDYFMFLANDDLISPNHIENYLSVIDGTDLDFVYFNTWKMGKHVDYKLKFGHIGDNAVIIRTEFLKQMPEREPGHGHDWQLIETMMLCGAKYKKSNNTPTYHIMSHADNRVDLGKLD
jgi:glycosyltransferase involved in cell wall biosynthesis